MDRATPRPRPLVVTLMLDASSEARLEDERRRYFPARLNQVPAHVSLFHALPGEQEAAVRRTLEEIVNGFTSFAVEVDDMRRYGGGVGYQMRATELEQVHARLRSAWLDWLTPQDRQGFRPHAMVQNKAGVEAAQALLQTLAGQFRPWQALAEGLRLWAYAGGPWEPLAGFRFRESGAPA